MISPWQTKTAQKAPQTAPGRPAYARRSFRTRARHTKVTTPVIWPPQVLDESQPEDRAALRRFQVTGRVRQVLDLLGPMLDELGRIRGDASPAGIRRILDGRSPRQYARQVFLPWQGALVRVLPKEDYEEILRHRNQPKIRPEEAAKLRQLRVGFMGLSVGAASARLTAQMMLAGELRLADFDRLELSNMNRLHASVLQLGQPKVAITAMHIWEQNPYTRLVLFPEGVTESNLDRFLGTGEQALHAVVEEADNLYMKMSVRQAARTRGIPVLMSTDDCGLMDIERFDLEPDRPLLHGLLSDIQMESLKNLTPAEALQIICRILEGKPSPRLSEALARAQAGGVFRWPQLASEVNLGGVQIAHALMRLGLGQDLVSGRTRLSID